MGPGAGLENSVRGKSFPSVAIQTPERPINKMISVTTALSQIPEDHTEVSYG